MELDSVNPVSLNSNIILTKFETLNKIIFVTSMWLRERISNFMAYIITRNSVFAFCQFIYGFFSSFSGTSLWSITQILTTLLISTMLPVISRGFFNKNKSEQELLFHPEYYSQQSKSIVKQIPVKLIFSFLLSLSLIILARLGFNNVRIPYGDSYSLPQFSYSVNTLFVIGSFAMLIPQIQTWTKIQHLITGGTFILFMILSSITTGKNRGQRSNKNNPGPFLISQTELNSETFSTTRLTQVENDEL